MGTSINGINCATPQSHKACESNIRLFATMKKNVGAALIHSPPPSPAITLSGKRPRIGANTPLTTMQRRCIMAERKFSAFPILKQPKFPAYEVGRHRRRVFICRQALVCRVCCWYG
jgi:hypothetical protein